MLLQPSPAGSHVSTGRKQAASFVAGSETGRSSEPQGKQTVDDVMQELEGTAADDVEDDIYGQYAWEQDVERSWDALVEHDGQLHFRQNLDNEFRRSYLETPDALRQSRIRKGMIRNVVLLFDMSVSMREIDIRPDRISCALSCSEELIREFSQQNPISYLGIVVMRNMNAEVIHHLSANPEEQIKVLRQAKRQGLGGFPSFQNGLERATHLLSSVPPYGTREVLVIYGSLRTIDPGNVDETIAKVKKAHIRLCVVSLAPETYILKKACTETKGRYAVALNKEHFRTLLLQHTQPPPW